MLTSQVAAAMRRLGWFIMVGASMSCWRSER